MRFVFLLGATVVAVVAFACDGDEPRTTIAPSRTVEDATSVSPPFVAPTTTPLPIPTILPPLAVPGWAIFHRGFDLWIGKLDGSSERALTRGALGSGFAGEAIGSDGDRMIYFTALTEQFGAPVVEGGEVDVYRQPLDGSGDAQLVTTIRIRREPTVLFRFGNKDVAVSPDNARLAYADETGVWIMDLASRSAYRLIDNRTDCSGTSPEICRGFSEPSWSYDGVWIAAREGYFEGSDALVFQPIPSLTPTGGRGDGPGGSWREWDPESSRLCASEGGYQNLGGGLLLADTTFVDIVDGLRSQGVIPSERSLVTGCAWAANGDFAFQYWRDPRGYSQPLLVLSSDGVFRAELDVPTQHGLTAWLPDSSGFIVTYGDGEGRPQSRILLPDGSLHELAVQTDDVIAVIPD